jgi:hypothetical protein
MMMIGRRISASGATRRRRSRSVGAALATHQLVVFMLAWWCGGCQGFITTTIVSTVSLASFLSPHQRINSSSSRLRQFGTNMRSSSGSDNIPSTHPFVASSSFPEEQPQPGNRMTARRRWKRKLPTVGTSNNKITDNTKNQGSIGSTDPGVTLGSIKKRGKSWLRQVTAVAVACWMCIRRPAVAGTGGFSIPNPGVPMERYVWNESREYVGLTLLVCSPVRSNVPTTMNLRLSLYYAHTHIHM